jgi:hypothetical protein
MTTPFDITNDADFYRWATPLLMYMISHGALMPPPRNPTHRSVFRLTLQRMATMSLSNLLANLNKHAYHTVSSLAGHPANCQVMKELSEKWPQMITWALRSGAWDGDEQEQGKGGDVGGGVDGVDGMDWDRMDVD